MAVRKLKLRMGLERVSKPLYPSEPGFVESVNRQLKALEDDVIDIMKQFEDASPDIMMEALEPNFEQSKVYCPKQTGALVNSGYLENTTFRGQPRVEIGYAKGGNPRYAVMVHENLDRYHAPPTQAKFLERAIMEDLDGIYQRLGWGYQEFAGAI